MINKFNDMIKQVVIVFLFLMIVDLTYSENIKKEIKVVFRFDDYAASSNTNLERDVFRVFEDTNLPLTVGVIPFRGIEKDSAFKSDSWPPEKIELLKKYNHRNQFEIALHGFNHGNNYTGEDKTFLSEFNGVDKELQYKMILKGKNFLERVYDTKVSIFIPPFGHYDKNTVLAIEEVGIPIISANFRSDNFKSEYVKFIPSTCTLRDLKRYVNDSREMRLGFDKVIVVVFHVYDFIEDDNTQSYISIEGLKKELDWVKQQVDVSVVQLKDVKDLLANDEPYQSAHNKYRALKPLYPPFLFSGNERILFSWKAYRITAYAKLILFYLLIFILFIAVGYILLKIDFVSKLRPVYLMSLLALGVVSLLIKIYFDDIVYYTTVVLLAALSGVLLGVIIGEKFKVKRENI